MTQLQLQAIVDTYNMLQKGLSNPIKINQVYQYINPMTGMEVPQRAKILAINRFMQLSYADVVKQLKSEERHAEEARLEESIGTFENKDKHSHQEKVDVTDAHDIQGFLTVYEKEDLKSGEAGTVLEVITPDGKKTRTRRKSTPESKHTKVVRK